MATAKTVKMDALDEDGALKVDPEVYVPQPVNVKQLVSHGAELFALTEAGEVWRRLMDPRDFNSGPGWTQKYLWQKIDVPHA